MAFPTASRKTDGAQLFPVRGLTQIMLFDKHLEMWQAPGMAFLKSEPGMAEFPLLLAPNREVYNRTGDVKQAISAGMKPYRAFGLEWSGEWMSMKVPHTSYISVSHGVKRMGYSCRDCHSPHGVLDFASLGYSSDEVSKLQRPVRVESCRSKVCGLRPVGRENFAPCANPASRGGSSTQVLHRVAARKTFVEPPR